MRNYLFLGSFTYGHTAVDYWSLKMQKVKREMELGGMTAVNIFLIRKH